ncbi:polyamine-modulated factor 1-binding protein 1 isoform 2-T3 [Ara ararauna]
MRRCRQRAPLMWLPMATRTPATAPWRSTRCCSSRGRQCQPRCLKQPDWALPAWTPPQHTGEQPCQHLGEDPQHGGGCEVTAVLQALQEEAASSRAEQAQGRELSEQLEAELSQWQWKHQVTVEQALQHLHAAAHDAEELQRSQKQLQTLREQAQSLQERLHELRSRAQYWQELYKDSTQALDMREEQLVVCKVELAFLKEELSKAMEQVQDRKRQHHSPRAGAQNGPPSTRE